MDTQASSQFIASLIKSIQVVCHGNVEFNHNIEIVGHIYLHVDKSQKFNYVLNEEVVKDSESTKFLSNSFPAEPPHRETERKRRKVATPSSTTESDGATEVITVGNDADEISSRPSHPPSSVSAASPTIVVPSNLSSSIRQRPRRPSFPANQSALSSSESERTPPPRSIATSQAQTLSQPQTRVPGISLSSDVKPDVSGQTSTSVSHPLSSRDSYVSSNPSLSSVNSAAATTTTTSEPDIQIKLEVPSEEEVQLLSHEIAGQVGGTSHPSQSGDPNSSTGSAPLYPVMLHQNLAATHSRDPGVPSVGHFLYGVPPDDPRHEILRHRLVLLPGGKERECIVCSRNNAYGGRRRRSRRYCPACDVGCHELCEKFFQHTPRLKRRRKRNAQQPDV